MTVNHGSRCTQFYHFSNLFVEYKPLISKSEKPRRGFRDFSIFLILNISTCLKTASSSKVFACWIKQLISTILVHLIANHSVENIRRLRTYTLATTWFTLATTWKRKWASFASSRKETQYYRTHKNGSVSKSVCLQIKVNCSFEVLLLSLSIIEACNSVQIFDFVSENNPIATFSSVGLCLILRPV